MTPTLIRSEAYRGDRIRIVWIQTQSDGAVTEYGPFVAIRPGAEDVTAYLIAHAARLVEALADAELAYARSQILTGVTADGAARDGRLAVFPALRYATTNDALAEIRALYQVATRVEAIMLGDYLSSLTDAALRALFDMTLAQVNSLRTNKLTPARTLADSIRAASGA